MKLTNQEIIRLLNGLMEIESIEMPVKLAYKLNVNNLALTECYKVYLKTLEPIKENNQKVEELLNLETQVDIKPVCLNEFDKAGLKITPLTLQNLLPMLKEVDDG